MINIEVNDMDNFSIRILKAEINNYKNVEYGKIDFTNKECDFTKANILGLYGQNGSGKTTLVNIFEILKTLLSGKALPNYISDFIKEDNKNSTFLFEFLLNKNHTQYKVIYQFKIAVKSETSNSLDSDNKKPKLFIESEKLQFKKIDDKDTVRYKDIINYEFNRKDFLLPKSRLDEIVGKNREIMDELRASRFISYKQATSFIFSENTLEILEKSVSKDVSEYFDIIKILKRFSDLYLFIITNKSTGLINANFVLPFSFRLESEDSLAVGSIGIKLEGTSIIPEVAFKTINKVIDQMNIVLKTIIPNLQIKLKNLGKETMKNGNTGISVELMSIKNNLIIPLQYESDGIKKIISILHMLICLFNNPSLTLVIDEFDSGIFEYLLGEILKIIEDSGRGQLIFTSHNLRPLETLNKNNIMFTTSNPLNRYIRLKNIGANNNLRNIYFHDIVLGGQNECIYEPTNSFNIAMAFRMAGDTNE